MTPERRGPELRRDEAEDRMKRIFESIGINVSIPTAFDGMYHGSMVVLEFPDGATYSGEFAVEADGLSYQRG